jgi:hypothetical protein
MGAGRLECVEKSIEMWRELRDFEELRDLVREVVPRGKEVVILDAVHDYSNIGGGKKSFLIVVYEKVENPDIREDYVVTIRVVRYVYRDQDWGPGLVEDILRACGYYVESLPMYW